MAKTDARALNGLGEEDRTELEKVLSKEFIASWDASGGLRDRAAKNRDMFAGVLPKRPRAWMSNVNIPLVRYMVRQAAINISRAALPGEPYFEVEAIDPQFEDAESYEEVWLQFWNENIRLKEKLFLAVEDALTTGQAWLKPGIKATGKPAPSYEQPTITLDELDVIPDLNVIVTEDMMLCPVTAPNFKLARGAFCRKKLRWNEIVQGVKSKTIYKDAGEYLAIQWMQPENVPQTLELLDLVEQVPTEIWTHTFTCWEGIFRWTKPGEDTETEWLLLVYWNEEEGGPVKVLKCTEYTQYFGDLWFFVPIIPSPKPNSMWGQALCDDLRGIQNWMNATFNQISDAVTLQVLPPIAINPTSEMYQRKMEWAPMQFWPMSNPADIHAVDLGGSANAGMGIAMGQLDFMRQMGERTSGVSDLSVGKTADEQRTATEIGAVVEAGNQIFEHHVNQVQKGTDENHGLEAYATLMMRIINKFMPAHPILYRTVKGSNMRWRTIDPMWHKGNYRFATHGAAGAHNPQIRLQKAQAAKQGAMQSPFMMLSMLDNPMTIAEKVRRWYRVESDYYQALGFNHIESLIGSQPQTIEEALNVAAAVNPQILMQILSQQPGMQQAGPGGGPEISGGGPEQAEGPGGTGDQGAMPAGGAEPQGNVPEGGMVPA